MLRILRLHRIILRRLTAAFGSFFRRPRLSAPLENSVDPSLIAQPLFATKSTDDSIIKTEEDADSVGDLIRDFLPTRQNRVVVGQFSAPLSQMDSDFTNQQFAWQYKQPLVSSDFPSIGEESRIPPPVLPFCPQYLSCSRPVR